MILYNPDLCMDINQLLQLHHKDLHNSYWLLYDYTRKCYRYWGQ